MTTIADWCEGCFVQSMDPDRCLVEHLDLDVDGEQLQNYFFDVLQNPTDRLGGFSRAQLANGIQFLFSFRSEYIKELRGEWASNADQVKLLSLLSAFYTEFLDVQCSTKAEDDTDFSAMRDCLDVAVVALWEGSCLEGAFCDPEQEYLVEPSYGLLEEVLMTCRTSGCQLSALVGLSGGHLYQPHRVEQIVEPYLRSCTSKWLKTCGEDAIRGRLGN